MESTVDLRQIEFNPKTNRNILERSGSLQKKALEYHHRESRKLRKTLSRRDKTIEQLMKETSMKCEVNQWSDQVFNDSTLKEAKKRLHKKGLSQDSIAAYAFEQSVKNHMLAKQNGNTCDTFGIDVSKYQPMIELFNSVDRLVDDIMNGKAFQGSRDKNVQLINCLKHFHITEL